MNRVLNIRFAVNEDIPLILYFIKELAIYEKRLDHVKITPEILEETLFGPEKNAEVILGFDGEKPISFAIFFHTFSTFIGKKTLYLEDLYVDPLHRGRGTGKEMMGFLSRIALERNCYSMNWSVLEWNKSAMSFYENLGGKIVQDAVPYKLNEESMKKIIHETQHFEDKKKAFLNDARQKLSI